MLLLLISMLSPMDQRRSIGGKLHDGRFIAEHLCAAGLPRRSVLRIAASHLVPAPSYSIWAVAMQQDRRVTL